MEYDPQEGRLHLLSDPRAPSASSEVPLVTREVSSSVSGRSPSDSSHGPGHGYVYTSHQAEGSQAAESGRKAAAEHTSKERAEVDKDLDLLEKLAREYQGPGTHTRVNLAPDAPRRRDGKLVKAIPSDMIFEGHPIFELCKKLNPDFKFNVVTLNRFTEPKECQLHKDKDNLGNSRIIFLGDFAGGALWLAGGRLFDQKRIWYEYNGSQVAH